MRARLKVSRAGVELIKSFEGLRSVAARLPDGRWTLGYGHTFSAREGATCTQEDADALLRFDLLPIVDAINNLVLVPLNQNPFDALVSFCFNIGVDNFAQSTVLKRINEGRMTEAALAMDAWRSAEFNGQTYVLAPLIRRRAAEKNLFLTPDDVTGNAPSLLVRPMEDLADAPPSLPTELNAPDRNGMLSAHPVGEAPVFTPAPVVTPPSFELSASPQPVPQPASLASERQVIDLAAFAPRSPEAQPVVETPPASAVPLPYSHTPTPYTYDTTPAMSPEIQAAVVRAQEDQRLQEQRQAELRMEDMRRHEQQLVEQRMREEAMRQAEMLAAARAAEEARQRDEARLREEARLQEFQRLEAQRLEQARLEQERQERERQLRDEMVRAELARLEQARFEQQRLEQEQLEQERQTQARLEQVRVERERLDREQQDAAHREAARLEAMRLDAERVEREREDAARVEQARLERERQEQQRIEQQRQEDQRRELERQAQTRLEQERVERERAEKERQERERAEAAKAQAAQPVAVATSEEAEKARKAEAAAALMRLYSPYGAGGLGRPLTPQAAKPAPQPQPQPQPVVQPVPQPVLAPKLVTPEPRPAPVELSKVADPEPDDEPLPAVVSFALKPAQSASSMPPPQITALNPYARPIPKDDTVVEVPRPSPVNMSAASHVEAPKSDSLNWREQLQRPLPPGYRASQSTPVQPAPAPVQAAQAAAVDPTFDDAFGHDGDWTNGDGRVALTVDEASEEGASWWKMIRSTFWWILFSAMGLGCLGFAAATYYRARFDPNVARILGSEANLTMISILSAAGGILFVCVSVWLIMKRLGGLKD